MTAFYQTIELQAAEIERLKQRENDLLNDATRYLERARKAEAELERLAACAGCGAEAGTMHVNGCSDIPCIPEIYEHDEGEQVVR